MTQLTKMRSF
ncbi:hypothetical protein MAR_000539 [Mya arenaria]|uniref:Uncharacterized protein n=1 Tax=Mya arenaria TaxID=6604 RepID=A0ABY7FHI4_MYAAR|nr:hypothetical protein MAR_000539 [Mya arenaria]